MSRESNAYWQLARQAREKADARTDELRGLLLTIVEAYALLARVQESLDDERDTPGAGALSEPCRGSDRADHAPPRSPSQSV